MIHVPRRWLIVSAALLASALAGVAAMLGPYAIGVRHFAADPAAGHHSDFYVYVPRSLKSLRPGERTTLLVQPNNSGTTSDDPGVHRRDAWWTGFERHAIADELGVVLLVPAFPRPASHWRVYTHALDRDVLTTARPELARLDLQLLSMIDRARATLATEGLDVDERVLVQGFSASGMFANRFTALHPRRVKAVAAGSPGGWPIAPVARVAGEPLAYPAGVADIATLTGCDFDADAFARVPQLVYLGTRDHNDSLDFEDGWESSAAAQVDRLFGASPLARWAPAHAIYRRAGANARFLLVDGAGHDRKALQAHSTAFLRDVLASERAASRRATSLALHSDPRDPDRHRPSRMRDLP